MQWFCLISENTGAELKSWAIIKIDRIQCRKEDARAARQLCCGRLLAYEKTMTLWLELNWDRRRENVLSGRKICDLEKSYIYQKKIGYQIQFRYEGIH